MKWIKHMTNARRDPVLLALKRDMGFAGVGMYWALVEAIAEHFEAGGEPELELDLTSWREITGIPPQSLRKLIKNLEETYKKLGKSSDFSASFSKKLARFLFKKSRISRTTILATYKRLASKRKRERKRKREYPHLPQGGRRATAILEVV